MDCLLCHALGSIKPFPADHEGRTNVTCTACHAPQNPGAVATEQPSPAQGVAGAIPHPVEGHEDCQLCHALGSIKPFPADHEGRTNVTCTACHAPQ